MSERDEDRIARLLRGTGRRTAPPPERAQRVFAAVHGHWRRELRRGLRRRVLWAGVAAAGLAGVLIAPLGIRREAAIVARVERAQGGALARGDAFEASSIVSTAAGERLACRLGSGHGVRVDGKTRLRFLSPREVSLERGALYVDSAGGSGAVAVHTRFGRIQDTGTQFYVRIEGRALRLGVREGTAELTASDERVAVEAGELLISNGQEHRVVRGSTTGADWAWVEDVAPALPIAGRSARVFLDWVAREQGRSLRFESPGVAASASHTLLQGSIEGMTPEQALAAVLPTCGMRHRVEGEVLHIGPVQRAEAGRE